MSEEYPLLYEDLSEEDKFVPRYLKRSHSMSLRGRAKNHVKGAAAIIKQWPGHWTSLLTYWWIGLGMIAITIFIIYNTLLSFAIIQPTNTMPLNSLNEIITQYKNPGKASDVYMHLFVNGTEAVDLNKYFPYIDIVSKEHKRFKFHFIIMLNDTSELPDSSEQLNNQLALNTILTSTHEYIIDTNIILEHMPLSRFLNTSPIQKYWRSLPSQFIRFLVRAVSVWEKGGIAVNPVIFTPQSPNPIYIEKLKRMLQNFQRSDINKRNNAKQAQGSIVKKDGEVKLTANNIQDILNEYKDDDILGYTEPTLEGAESRHIINISINNTFSNNVKDATTKSHLNNLNYTINAHGERTIHPHQEEGNADSVSKMLPLFFNYFFHKDSLTNLTTETKTTRIRKSTTTKVISEKERVAHNTKNKKDILKPMIVKPKGIVNDSNIVSTITTNSSNKMFELTVDLKGNLIATQTPCHAFIGDMFTNVVHHDKTETLTDFIIKELSIFCKGLLTSCVGIDIILI